MAHAKRSENRSTGPRLPSEVAERIGPYYVYMLVDPRDGKPFYVGKGTKQRVEAHARAAFLDEHGSTAKVRRIREIVSAGLQPRIDIVRHGLTDEQRAYEIEAAVIDALEGVVELTNVVDGHGHDKGRAPIDEWIHRYGAQPLEATGPPVLLIRLQPRWNALIETLERGYRRSGAGWYPGISQQELFDATRGWWRVSPASVSRRGVEHAVPVVSGVTRAVYRVTGWVGPRRDGRWAFTGEILNDGPVFDAYVGPWGHRVPFASASQNPTTYWPPRT